MGNDNNGSNQFKVGDQVFGISLFGGYSSLIIVPENYLYKLPNKMKMEEAAGFLAVALTAYYSIYHLFPI